MRFLRPLECFIGIFHGLLGMLVPSPVIFFPMVRGGSTVRVCGEFVELRSSLVRVIWHSATHPLRPLHLRIIPFSKLFNTVHSRRAAFFTLSLLHSLTLAPLHSFSPCDLR